MTDARLGGLGRETLVTADGSVRLGGVAREALLSGVTPVMLGALAREVLLMSPLVVAAVGRNVAVSINTG